MVLALVIWVLFLIMIVNLANHSLTVNIANCFLCDLIRYLLLILELRSLCLIPY